MPRPMAVSTEGAGSSKTLNQGRFLESFRACCCDFRYIPEFRTLKRSGEQCLGFFRLSQVCALQKSADILTMGRKQCPGAEALVAERTSFEHGVSPKP